jgi:hypothetical protein
MMLCPEAFVDRGPEPGHGIGVPAEGEPASHVR